MQTRTARNYSGSSDDCDWWSRFEIHDRRTTGASTVDGSAERWVLNERVVVIRILGVEDSIPAADDVLSLRAERLCESHSGGNVVVSGVDESIAAILGLNDC